MRDAESWLAPRRSGWKGLDTELRSLTPPRAGSCIRWSDGCVCPEAVIAVIAVPHPRYPTNLGLSADKRAVVPCIHARPTYPCDKALMAVPNGRRGCQHQGKEPSVATTFVAARNLRNQARCVLVKSDSRRRHSREAYISAGGRPLYLN